jgi:hypothetical protein
MSRYQWALEEKATITTIMEQLLVIHYGCVLRAPSP